MCRYLVFVERGRKDGTTIIVFHKRIDKTARVFIQMRTGTVYIVFFAEVYSINHSEIE